MDLYNDFKPSYWFDEKFKGSDKQVIRSTLGKLNSCKTRIFESRKQKNANQAEKKLSEAKKLFKSFPSSIYKLLKLYSEAIAYAPNDSSELARAYGNRSAILYNARLYEDSLKDIKRAMALDYPEKLKAKLYTRKVKNLLALGHDYQSDVTQAIAEAHVWIEKMDDADKKIQESLLEKLIKQKSFIKPFEKLDNSCIMPNINDASQVFEGTSNAVKLKYSATYGRQFIATRDIKPGEVLVKQRAYASVLSRKLFYINCWNCLKRAWASIPCKHCVNVVFCSENCRNEAWKNFHDIECPTITIISTEELRDEEFMSIRVTIKALKEVGSIALLKEKLEEIDSILDPITKAFTDGKLDGSKIASVYTLASSPSQVMSSFEMRKLFACAYTLFAFAYGTTVFGKKIDNINELVENESTYFLGSLLKRSIYTCMNNSFTGNFYQQEKISVDEDDTQLGGILSCVTSYFNHSCDSNASIVHSGDVMGICSIQQIKKNEQIFICYDQPYYKSPTINRQSYLLMKFGFSCECHACKENWGPELEFEFSSIPFFGRWTMMKQWESLIGKKPFVNPGWPTMTKQILTRKAKDNVENAYRQFYEYFKCSNPSDCYQLLHTEPRCIPVLSALLGTLCENYKYPSKEILQYKETLAHNYKYNSY